MSAEVRRWRLHRRTWHTIGSLAREINPVVRGWLNYYGQFYRSECLAVLRHSNDILLKWVRRKFKRFRYRARAAVAWLRRIAQQEPALFVLWQFDVRP